MRQFVSKRLLPLIIFLGTVGGTWLLNDRAAVGEDNPEAAATTTPAQPPAEESLRQKLSSPRETMKTFLRAYREDGNRKDAAAALDLSKLNANVRNISGPDYAQLLKQVIDRMWFVNYAYLPDDPDSKKSFRLDEAATKLTGQDADDAAMIVIARDSNGLWRFTTDTVAAIDGLWDRWKGRPPIQGVIEAEPEVLTPLWLEQRFPTSLTETHFLLPDYQWICLLVLIFLGFAADLIMRWLLGRATQAWVKVFRPNEKIAVEGKIFKPVGLLTQGFVWYKGTMVIGMPALALSILLIALKIFTVVAAVWTGFLLVDALSAYLERKAAKTDTKFDDLLVQLTSKSLKVFVVCIGVLTAAQAFGLPIAGLIGGLGIGGMALALASKDAVANLFGSFTVLVDRPFEVGDWVVTNGVEGSVETVGFRSTRIRTFYNSLITLPNSLLTTTSVDNMGARRYRRIKTVLGVQYDTTPEQMDAFCEGIRELLRRHPYTRKDYYHVYFNGFSDSSLDVLLYCFLECPDWAIELREKHVLYNDILRLAQQLDVEFAFPTRTLHMLEEHTENVPAPPDLPDPENQGRRLAATIAGPLPGSDQRRGPVAYSGPAEFEARGDSDMDDSDMGDEA